MTTYNVLLDVLLPCVTCTLAGIAAVHSRRSYLLRRRTADDAQSNHRELTRLIESAAEAAAVLNAEGDIVAWNRGAETMFGWTGAEVLHTPARDKMSGPLRAIYARHLAQVAVRGTSDFVGAVTPMECLCKSGALILCEVTVSVWSDHTNTYTGAVFRDITARQKAERDLSRLALAVDHAQEAIVITDPDGTIVYVNPAFERASGYARAEVLGRNPSLLKSGKQGGAFYAGMWSTLLRGEVWTGTLVNRRKDGSFYEEDGSISPVRDATGQIVNYVAVKRDITQERALEVQLRHAQKLESVGRLAAGIAHEINTPMQFIGDSARYLTNAFDDTLHALEACERALTTLAAIPGHEEAARGIAVAVEAADIPFAREEIPRALSRVLSGVARVSSIVRAMKEFAHPGQHEHASADLNHLIQTTLIVAHNEYKHVACVDSDFGQLPPVLCDAGELNQVFLNLIVNAAQAIGDDPARGDALGTITIRTRAAGDHVVVEISDTGPGIPEPIRAQVFDPFFTTKPVGKGTGQGLAISRSIIVDKHQGSLSIESEPGKGATFVIRIPVAHQLQSLEVAA